MQSTEIKTLTIVTGDGNITYALNDIAGRALIAALQILVNGKQDTLVSGNNIKTINNTSLLGSGNINIPGGTDTTALKYYQNTLTNTYSINASFAANERCYRVYNLQYGTSVVNLAISLNNRYDNYILLANRTNYDLTLNLQALTYGGNNVANVILPAEAVLIKAGNAVELSVACPENTYAILTRSADLKLP